MKTSVAGTDLVGRMTVGNKNGLLLPNSTTDQGEGSRERIAIILEQQRGGHHGISFWPQS